MEKDNSKRNVKRFPGTIGVQPMKQREGRKDLHFAGPVEWVKKRQGSLKLSTLAYLSNYRRLHWFSSDPAERTLIDGRSISGARCISQKSRPYEVQKIRLVLLMKVIWEIHCDNKYREGMKQICYH